jgi:hypothetical protein
MRPTGQYPGSIYDLRVVIEIINVHKYYTKQELLTFREHMGSPTEIWCNPVTHCFSFLCCFFFILFVFILCLVPNVGCITDLSIIDWPFGSSNIYSFAMTYFC